MLKGDYSSALPVENLCISYWTDASEMFRNPLTIGKARRRALPFSTHCNLTTSIERNCAQCRHNRIMVNGEG
jgi:hypothetical protein